MVANHPDTLASMNDLAVGYLDTRKLDLALPLFEETLRLRKATLGDEHRSTALSMSSLAIGYLKAKKFDLALPILKETLRLEKARLGADHPNTLTSMHNLAGGYMSAKKFELALPLGEETLKLRKVRQGADHPDTLKIMRDLAAWYTAAQKFDLALPLLEETLKLSEAKRGANDSFTLNIMNRLGVSYHRAKRLDKSIPLYEESLKLMEAKQGRQHEDTLITIFNLGMNYMNAGRVAEALPLMEEGYLGLKQREQLETPPPPLRPLFEAYLILGKKSEAATLSKELRKETISKPTNDQFGFARELAAWGLSEEAAALVKEIVKNVSSKSPSEQTQIQRQLVALGLSQESSELNKVEENKIRIMSSQAKLYLSMGKNYLAKPLLEEAYAESAKPSLQASQWSIGVILIDCYVKTGKTEKAKKIAQEVLTGIATLNLGVSLVGQQKYDEAKPLLITGYEGMKNQKTPLPTTIIQLPEALDYIIEMYTALEKTDEVKKWQAERDMYPNTSPP